MSPLTKIFLGLNEKPTIKAFIVEGEIVDYLQRNKLNMQAEGTIEYLKASYLPPYTPTLKNIRTLQRINNHLMSTVRKKINQR